MTQQGTDAKDATDRKRLALVATKSLVLILKGTELVVAECVKDLHKALRKARLIGETLRARYEPGGTGIPAENELTCLAPCCHRVAQIRGVCRTCYAYYRRTGEASQRGRAIGAVMLPGRKPGRPAKLRKRIQDQRHGT